MSEGKEQRSAPKKLRMPGPLWLWIVAALLSAQILKRMVIGWPIPQARDFNFGNRFLENLTANLVLGAPVLVAFLLCLWWVNRGKPGN